MSLGLAALALVVAGTLTLVRLHLLPTGYSPVRDAVSDYGVGRHHLYYRAMVVFLGVGAGLLAAGLARDTDVASGGLVWLWVYAVSRVLIAGFMIDPHAGGVSPEGRVHLLLAAAAFTAIAFASGTLSPELRDEPGWEGIGGTLVALGYGVGLSAIATLVTRVVPAFNAVFGAAERALYATSLLWLLLVAGKLVSLAS